MCSGGRLGSSRAVPLAVVGTVRMGVSDGVASPLTWRDTV